MKRVSTVRRLTKLRELLATHNYKAYLIPSEDEHFNEYVDPCDKRCSFLSGFTGSVCTAIVTLDKAALWVDGRYHLQASQQVDDNWTVMKKGVNGVPNEACWLVSSTPPGARIGYDSRQLPSGEVDALKREILEAEAVSGVTPTENKVHHSSSRELVADNGENLVDTVWSLLGESEGCIRPNRPANPVTVVPASFSGSVWQEKFQQVVTIMKQKKVSLLVTSALDEIAWFLNIRGSEIQYNPVFFAYMMVSLEEIFLFLDPRTLQCSPGLKDHLADPAIKVHIYPYQKFFETLKSTVIERPFANSRVWFAVSASQAMVSQVPEPQRFFDISPIAHMKSIKSNAELTGIRVAHVKDSLVLCDFLAWLENVAEVNQGALSDERNEGLSRSSDSPLNGKLCEPAGQPPLAPPESLTELSLADYINKLRAQADGFVSLSFETISCADANGALIHYSPAEGQDAPVTRSSLYLIDSGGQYQTGTTDVTRTVHLGQPSADQKACYTMVLKSHIALASQVFPSNTPGSRLDVIARHVMWQYQCDYLHGTGHGVGAFLCVHEGPMGLSGNRMRSSARLGLSEVGIRKDMVVTIEPGFYLANRYGVRLENVVFVVNAPSGSGSSIPSGAPDPSTTWLTFQPVTLVPFQRRMIDHTMLTQSEVKWLNDYHATVCQTLQSRIMQEADRSIDKCLSSSRQRCLNWLMRETEPFKLTA
ncbi:unnamed protein product [Calicophoron daubneyi]|uniref:Xaa-Pro aminopeptidase 1 n=1 Tax=Calicophoron daubneyi TaxID=300641 RepID=A0AAV2TLJ3_CALDB